MDDLELKIRKTRDCSKRYRQRETNRYNKTNKFVTGQQEQQKEYEEVEKEKKKQVEDGDVDKKQKKINCSWMDNIFGWIQRKKK